MLTDRIKPDWTQTTYLTQVDWVHIEAGYKQAGYKKNWIQTSRIYKQAEYKQAENTQAGYNQFILDTKTEYKETRCKRLDIT